MQTENKRCVGGYKAMVYIGCLLMLASAGGGLICNRLGYDDLILYSFLSIAVGLYLVGIGIGGYLSNQ